MLIMLIMHLSGRNCNRQIPPKQNTLKILVKLNRLNFSRKKLIS